MGRSFFYFVPGKRRHRILARRKQSTYRKDPMLYGPPIERLKKDSNELKHYIKRLEKEGNNVLAFKLQKKQAYLSSRIEDMHEVTSQRLIRQQN